MNTPNTIFGYDWDQICAAQQKRGSLGKTILTHEPKKPPTDQDKALLEQHGSNGLRAMELWGVLDRLNLL